MESEIWNVLQTFPPLQEPHVSIWTTFNMVKAENALISVSDHIKLPEM